MNGDVLPTQWDWLCSLGPAAAFTFFLLLIARLLRAAWPSGRRWALAVVLAVLLVAWPSAWYAANYAVRYEEVSVIWPSEPDSPIHVASSADLDASASVAKLRADGFGTYIEWSGLHLPPGRMYFLELEMSVGAGHLSRLEWVGADGVSHATVFQGFLHWTGVTPRYDGAFHRYFVIMGKLDYPVVGLRVYPSNAQAAVALSSVKIVALP